MSLVSILISYFGLPTLALMITMSSFDVRRKYKKLYPNDVVTAFNIKIKKVSVSLIFAISVLIFFFIILIINTLVYLSVISSNQFNFISPLELLISLAFLAIYLILSDSDTKKK